MSYPNVVPDWWAFVLLALAAFRVYRIIGQDEITERPRNWLLARLREEGGRKATLFLVCPWCLGWWLSLAAWLAWLAWPEWTVGLAVPFALSAIVGLVTVNLDPD